MELVEVATCACLFNHVLEGVATVSNRGLHLAFRNRSVLEMASDMDIIRRYSRYMKHRSGCNKVQMIYMPSDRVSKLDYYTMISVADNLFFVIEIGESQVLYYWKAPVILTGLNMITNRYTDDCEYIADYDTIRNRHNKVEVYTARRMMLHVASTCMAVAGTVSVLCIQSLLSFPTDCTVTHKSDNVKLQQR